jgi:type III pantothenate kinase
MLLAIDVGNTQTVVGLYASDDDGSTRAELLDHWRIATNAERTSDEYALVVQEFLAFHGFSFAENVNGLAVSSVVPRVTAAVREMCLRYFGFLPLIVEPGVRTGMPILYDNPKEVGADRIANAVGAYDLYGGPTIIVDFGTATTLDAVSGKGEYLGGAILPGIEISLDALFERAAALRRVELAEPRNVIGRSTVESLQSGAVYGFTSQVDGMCERFREELGDITVVATGGLASVIAPLSKSIEHHEPWLTLHGLRLIYERNRAKPG